MYKSFLAVILCGSAWSLSPIDEIAALNKEFKALRSSYEGKISLDQFEKGQAILNGTTYKVSNQHYASSAERQEAFTFYLHRALHQPQKPIYTLNPMAPLGHTAALYVYEWVAYYLAKKPEFLFKSDSLWDRIQIKRRKQNHFTKHLDPARQKNGDLVSKINDYLATNYLQKLFGGINPTQILRETSKGTYDYSYEWLATALDIYENPEKRKSRVKCALENGTEGYQIIYNEDNYPVALLKPKMTQNPTRKYNRRDRGVNVELEATQLAQKTGFASAISEVFDYNNDLTIEPYLSLVPALYRNEQTSKSLFNLFLKAAHHFDDHQIYGNATLDSLKKTMFSAHHLTYFFEDRITSKRKSESIDDNFIAEKDQILKASDPSNLALFVGAMGVLNLWDAHNGNVAVQIMPNEKLKYTHFDLEYAFDHPNPRKKNEVNLPFVLMGQLSNPMAMPGHVPSILKKQKSRQNPKLKDAHRFWTESYWNTLPIYVTTFLCCENKDWRDLLILMAYPHTSKRSPKRLLTYWDQYLKNKSDLIEIHKESRYYMEWKPDYDRYAFLLEKEGQNVKGDREKERFMKQILNRVIEQVNR